MESIESSSYQFLPTESSEGSIRVAGSATHLMKNLDEDRKSNQELCDVTICTETKEFHAHKCVISGYSDFFRRMFCSKMKEQYTSTANIVNIDADVMSIILDFIYSCEITITQDNVYELLSAADFLQIQDIKMFCSICLRDAITLDSCLIVWEFARRYDLDTLLTITSLFITVNFQVIVQREDFKELCLHDFLLFIGFRPLNISEDVMYNTVIAWTKHKLPDRQKNIYEVFRYIDPNKLTRLFLKNIVSKESLILQSSECVSQLLSLMWDRIPEEHELVIIGGLPNKRAVSKFNLKTKKMIQLLDMELDRCNASAVVINRILYVLGGQADKSSKSYKSFVSVDLNKTDLVWNQMPPISVPRSAAGCAALGETIYICGGKSHDTMWLEACERFDVVDHHWYSLPSMNTKRSDFALIALNGLLYAIGGCQTPNTFLDSVECYDIKKHSWTFVSSLNCPRGRFAAVALNGKIYALGGESNFAFLRSIESYDPMANVWFEVTSLSCERYNHAACAMGDNIYTLGGCSTLEAYNPASDECTIVDDIGRRLGSALVAI